MASLADPKPERKKGNRLRRIVHPAAVLAKCLADRECRICGYPPGGGHHIVPRGAPHFGDDVPENIVPLCGSGTTGCHGNVENLDEEACRALGRRLRREEIVYVYSKLGQLGGRAFLRRYYHRED